jgi:hypothetical protein
MVVLKEKLMAAVMAEMMAVLLAEQKVASKAVHLEKLKAD